MLMTLNYISQQDQMKHINYEKFKNVKDWMTNFLLLNSDKSEILLIGPKNSTQKLLDLYGTKSGCYIRQQPIFW